MVKSPSLNTAPRKELSRSPDSLDDRHNYRSRSVSKQNNRYGMIVLILRIGGGAVMVLGFYQLFHDHELG